VKKRSFFDKLRMRRKARNFAAHPFILIGGKQQISCAAKAKNHA